MKSKIDLIKFAGYNIIFKKKFDKDISQLGIFSLMSIDDKLLNKNEFLLTYNIIYHFLLKLNEREKIPIFLDDNIDTNLFEDNEDNDPNIINDDSTKFIENLKNIFKNRMDELGKQYYVNYNDEKIKQLQKVYELLFEKIMKYSPIQKDLNYFKEEYSDLKNLKIFVGTWNVACTDPNNKDLNLDSWLLPKDPNIIPDIYLIGFQEVVELNATNVITGGKQQIILSQWNSKIISSINKIGKYVQLVDMNLVGIYFCCYVLKEKSDNIKNISQKIVKTGLGGTTGNKGSCCINFDYFNTSFSIACSHLAAGAKKNRQRLHQLDYILKMKLDHFISKVELDKKGKDIDLIDNMDYNTEDENNRNYSYSSLNINQGNSLNNGEMIDDSISFKNSDIWIIFGDLNFRVDMEYEEFSEYVKKGNWNKLIDYDQFIKFKLASIDYMNCIQEDEIKFAPTYKYSVNSNEYDYKPKNKKKKNQNKPQGSGKKRNPSWCDRVFYKKNAYVTKNGQKIITGVEYNNAINDNFTTSDHRPVYQIFDVIIFKENSQKKDAIEKELLSNEK